VLKTLPESAGDTDSSDTALGDWYVNRIVVDRQPLLLLVSSESRLAMLTPARDVKNLPRRVGDMVAARLRRLGVDDKLVRAEVAAMDTARVGRTRDRSITGQMVDFAKATPCYLPADGWDDSTLRLAEDRLSETPCLAGRSFAETIFPDRTAARLLHERWANYEERQ
jgi:hypothetical protein